MQRQWRELNMMIAKELNRDVLSSVLSALLRLQTVCLQGL